MQLASLIFKGQSKEEANEFGCRHSRHGILFCKHAFSLPMKKVFGSLAHRALFAPNASPQFVQQ
jgi:hypothetical protein